MIVRPRPGPFTLLFTLQGSIVPLVAPRILFVAAVSAAVTALHHWRPGLVPELPATPLTLLGLGLSIFLGFRNSACYDRWWEGRKQWGQLLTEARCLSRLLLALLPAAEAGHATRRILAFATALAARLRGTDPAQAARPYSPPGEPTGAVNLPDAVLRRLTAELAAQRRGQPAGLGEMEFLAAEAHVAALCGIAAACDRIRTTPTPFAYTLLLHRTAWLFCLLAPFTLVNTVGLAAPLVSAILAYAFFGLDALGDELEEPFALRPNTLPLDAMVRTLEIELLEALGETALPEALSPRDHMLR